MRIFPRRLGPKLNLSLLVFLVLLGAATAGLVLLGFRRTQDNATKTSGDGLEAQAKQTLLLLAATQAQFGQSQLEATAGFGQQAARYMLDARSVVNTTKWDPARLAKNPQGATYDPDPNRITSVYVPASIPVDEKVLRDLRDSAVLDATFPSILAGYTGETHSSNFDAVSIYFNSVNGVTRYFPALPVEQFAASTDPRNMVAAEGPGANPTRATRWTAPYTDKTGHGQVISATIPVYDGDEYRGIIGMDVTLSNLAAQIDLVKPSPNGYAFYLDRKGELFQTAASPTIQAAIDDEKNTGFAGIVAAMRAGETNVGRAEIAGQEVFVGYAPIGDVGGSFALVTPIKDVTQQATLVANGIDDQGNRTLAFVLVTMLLFFGAALVAAAWLNRRTILRPIEEIVAGTQAVAAGNLVGRIPVRSSDELGMLADSFNVMTGEVREARESLEQRVEERTRELSVLLNVSQSVASKIELGPLLSVLLTQLGNVVDYYAVSVLMRQGDDLVLLDVDSDIGGSPDNPYTGRRFPARGAIWQAMERGEAVVIPDVWDETETWATHYRNAMRGQDLDGQYSAGVKSWLSVPLVAQESVIGSLAIASGEPDYFTPDRVSIVRGIASQAAVGVVNARLFEETQQRTRELTTLLEVAHNVGSTLELDPLLHLVLEQVRFVVPHDRAALLIRDGDDNLRVAAAIGSPDQPAPLAAPGMSFPIGAAPLLWNELKLGKPIIIDDIRGDDPMAVSYRSLLGPLAERALALVRAWMAAPLMFENRLIGIVILSRGEVGAFTQRHAQLTTAIGTQAGIAIENARLFAETEERTRELGTLLDVSDEVASMLELEPLLDLILDRLQRVAPYDRAGFLLLEGDDLIAHAVAVREGVIEGQIREQIGMRFSTLESGLWDAVGAGQPVIVDDVRDESPEAAAYQQVTGEHFDTVFARIRSWMAVPVTAKDRVIGLVALSKEQPGFYTPRHGELAKAIASQAGVGIENARLFKETQERTRELASLLDVARNVASTLELRPLLRVILQQVRSMANFDRAGLMLRYGDELRVEAVLAADGGAEDEVGTLGSSYPLGGILWDEISQGRHVIIDDVRADTKLARAYRRITGLPLETVWNDTRSWMGVPIELKGEVIGMVVMSHAEFAYFTDHHAQLVTAIASQAGVAVDNARLFQRSERRTQELSALLDISRGIASTLERDPLVATILDRLRGIVDYRGASILRFEGDMVRVLDFNRYQVQDGREPQSIVFPKELASGFWTALARDGSSLVNDIRDGKAGSLEFQRVAGPLWDTAFRNVRSFLAVPLESRDETIGALTLSHPDAGFFTPDQVRLVRAVADQAAVALENARLFEETQQRTRELSALLEVGRHVGSTLELHPLLRLILEQVLTVVPYDRSNIITFDGDDLTIMAGHARPGVEMLDQVGVHGRVSEGGRVMETVLSGQPAIIDDIRDDTPLAREYRERNAAILELALERVGSLMAVPIMLNDQVVGMMGFTQKEPRSFTSRHADLAMAIGSQAGVAIENARLFEETQQSARELAALLSVAQSVASTIELEPLLMVLVEQLRTVIECYGVTILTSEGDEVSLLDVSNAPVNLAYSQDTGRRVPLAGAIWQAMQRGESVVVPNIWSEEDAWARRYRRNLGERLEDPAFAAVNSWLAVPLETPDRVGGMLMVSSKEFAYFTPQRQALVRGIANQAAVAIENARLFEETQRGARELSGLLDVTQSIASTLNVRKASGLILDHLKNLVDYTSGSLSILEDNALGILENRGPLPDEWLTQMRMEGLRRSELPVPEGQSPDDVRLLDMLSGDVVVIDDIWGDDEVATAFRRGSEASAERAGISLDPARSLHSYLRIPIVAQQRVVGLLVLHHELVNFYTPQRVRLAQAVADQAAVAIENARLFEETRRRARETEALFRADEQLFQSLSLDAVFQALVDVCVDVLGVPKSLVTTVEDIDGHYKLRASRNLSQFSLDKMLEIRERRPRTVLAGVAETLVNPDARASLPEMLPVFEAEGIYVTVDVPIKSTGTLRGWLGAAYTSRRALTADEIRLLQALAERAAVAIDNAELYERAQQVASLEERQKLARELHDSVSQALYGIALGARTARTLLDRDPAKAVEPMDYVLSLAEAGLTEMRALIFELRPESLESEGLVVAIEKNVAATQVRYGIEVVADLCPEPTAPLDVKEAAYRIAQEALHNIVKHAGASRVDIRLTHDVSTLTLEVSDNGVGFDPGGAFPGHIGLSSMRERTAKGGGSIEIESAPGQGTKITARLRV